MIHGQTLKTHRRRPKQCSSRTIHAVRAVEKVDGDRRIDDAGAASTERKGTFNGYVGARTQANEDSVGRVLRIQVLNNSRYIV